MNDNQSTRVSRFLQNGINLLTHTSDHRYYIVSVSYILYCKELKNNSLTKNLYRVYLENEINGVINYLYNHEYSKVLAYFFYFSI